MLSIIIPTLNEETYLPKLLESIRKQSFKDYEIIVADNDSKDKTRQIAKKYKCKIVNGGLPPKARNNGAKAAKGDILFFIDADCNIKNNFLQRAMNEIRKRKLDVATCFVWPLSDDILNNVQFCIYNLWIYSMQLFYANASGHGIFCKKGIHKKINGFDENIKLSEDMDYAKRASRFGKFRILTSVNVFTSVRRFEEEGRLKVGLKLLLSAFYRIFIGEIKSDIFKYRFGHKNRSNP